MANCIKWSNVSGVKLIVAFHIILLYYMISVNIYHAEQTVGTKLDKTKPHLESVPNSDHKMTVGIPDGRLMNAIVTSYREDIKLKLMELVSRKANPRDPELLSLVRELMDPPSGHIVKRVRNIVETPQSLEILKCLKKRVSGCSYYRYFRYYCFLNANTLM